MIPRYSLPTMSAIWEAKNRYKIWFEIEASACEAMAELGEDIPASSAQIIRQNGEKAMAAFSEADRRRIDDIEAETRHDVIAFLTWLAEKIGPESRFVHLGMTSSDILDTTFSVQLNQAADILLDDLKRLLVALEKRAFEHKHTLTIGRSHGIHAEPLSFGLKLAGYYAEFSRNYQRLQRAQEEIATCAISGAVGTYAHIDPRVEEYVARKLGLQPEPVSTQVIPRDRHAAFFTALAIVASSIERLAVEIRHLQRSEVREAEEYFHPGQKGSSAMPHKRNPVLTENLTGLARLVRSYSLPALENVALWHERDISHSSVERTIGPDATIALDFALNRLAEVIEKLVIYPDRMMANLESLGGVVHSGEVLLALVRVGISREDAYRIIQRNAMKTWERLGQKDWKCFRENLLGDEEVSGRVPENIIDAAMDNAQHLKHIDYSFKKVFGKAG
ncbi:adenylosuccinate lyase [Entomobacter blattae]|uniref:Adenylosuccinate lyase n=1 Tax=Entomobacter blattae TaxID=2762277 RepID=A0A7H1NSG5_9PROT|nr:adenylosuccinate lyase [Entomobacter blattae]QNT78725.1 Adenylosuccinate lyase [Entomobacter blattae]